MLLSLPRRVLWPHHDGLKSLQLPDDSSPNTSDLAGKALQTQLACVKATISKWIHSPQ
jgi:hypothetical protein